MDRLVIYWDFEDIPFPFYLFVLFFSVYFVFICIFCFYLYTLFKTCNHRYGWAPFLIDYIWYFEFLNFPGNNTSRSLHKILWGSNKISAGPTKLNFVNFILTLYGRYLQKIVVPTWTLLINVWISGMKGYHYLPHFHSNYYPYLSYDYLKVSLLVPYA